MLRDSFRVALAHKIAVIVSGIYSVIALVIGASWSHIYYSRNNLSCGFHQDNCMYTDPTFVFVGLIIMASLGIVWKGPSMLSKRSRYEKGLNNSLLVPTTHYESTDTFIESVGELDEASGSEIEKVKEHLVSSSQSARYVIAGLKDQSTKGPNPIVLVSLLMIMFYIPTWLALLLIVDWPPNPFEIQCTVTIQVLFCMTVWYLVAEF